MDKEPPSWIVWVRYCSGSHPECLPYSQIRLRLFHLSPLPSSFFCPAHLFMHTFKCIHEIYVEIYSCMSGSCSSSAASSSSGSSSSCSSFLQFFYFDRFFKILSRTYLILFYYLTFRFGIDHIAAARKLELRN